MQAINCPKCGAPLQAAVTACPYCGVGLASETSPARDHPQERIPPPVEIPPGWRLYKDAWHGFQIAFPPGWRVETYRGQISVRQDPAGLTQAVIWPSRLPAPSTARQMAVSFVAAGNRLAHHFQVWEQGNAAPDSNRITLRTRQVRFGQTVEGILNILVDGANCVISGFEAPDQQIAALSPTLGQILSTFRPLEMAPRFPVREPKENAYQFWLPQGWTFQADINRSTVSGVGIPQFSIARDPQGQVMAVQASQQSVYQDVMSAFMVGFMGYDVKQFMPADQYCTKIAAKFLAKGQKNFRVESVTLRPDLAEIEANNYIQMGYPPGIFEPSLAVIEMTYDAAGARLRQRTRIGTLRQLKPINLFAGFNPYWTATLSVSSRAPEGELDDWEPFMMGVLESVQPNPAWEQNEQQRVAIQQQYVQNYIANAQADMANRRMQISQTLSDTSSIISNAYWAQQPTYDRLSEIRSNTMLGVQNVAADSGEVYKVPYGYDQYWMDGLGNMMGGSWMVQPGVDWKPLTLTGT